MLLKKPLPWVQDVAHEVQSHWCSNTPLLGKPSSRVHCQKKQDHIWCGGNKWLWHALGAGEVQLRRWVLETRWAPSHKGSNVTHSSKNVFLWPPLLLLSVFMWQTHSCFKTFGAAAGSLLSEGAHTQTKVRQAPLGLYHGTVSTSILWITQLGSVTKSTRWSILGQLMVLSSAVSLIKEEKTGVGWDLPLGRSSHRHLAHQHLLFTEGFATPQTRFHLLPPFQPVQPPSHPTIPEGGDTLASTWRDEILFFFKDLVAATTFQTRRPRQYFAVSTTKWSALLSVTLKTSQKSLRKRVEEQHDVRSCSAHQVWVRVGRAVTQGLERAA